jgi:hypothetical protein
MLKPETPPHVKAHQQSAGMVVLWAGHGMFMLQDCQRKGSNVSWPTPSAMLSCELTAAAFATSHASL